VPQRRMKLFRARVRHTDSVYRVSRRACIPIFPTRRYTCSSAGQTKNAGMSTRAQSFQDCIAATRKLRDNLQGHRSLPDQRDLLKPHCFGPAVVLDCNVTSVRPRPAVWLILSVLGRNRRHAIVVSYQFPV
jgi:hypothetical protein